MNAAKAASRMRRRTGDWSAFCGRCFDVDRVCAIFTLDTVPFGTIILSYGTEQYRVAKSFVKELSLCRIDWFSSPGPPAASKAKPAGTYQKCCSLAGSRFARLFIGLTNARIICA